RKETVNWISYANVGHVEDFCSSARNNKRDSRQGRRSSSGWTASSDGGDEPDCRRWLRRQHDDAEYVEFSERPAHEADCGRGTANQLRAGSSFRPYQRSPK